MNAPARPGRVWVLAANTVVELARMKVSSLLLLFAGLLIGSSVLFPNFSFEEEFQMLKDVALGAMAIFGSLLAIVATAGTLPRDIEERTIYTILSKPVTRLEYLLGKLLGVFALLAIAIALMSAIYAVTLRLRVEARASEIAADFHGGAGAGAGEADDAAREIDRLRARAYDPAVAQGILLLYAKACVMASVTLLLASFATSPAYAMIVAVMVYMIGHVQAIARQAWLEGDARGPLHELFAGAVTLLFPDLAMFDLADEIVAGAVIPPDLLPHTLALGGGYCVAYLAIAYLVFRGREL